MVLRSGICFLRSLHSKVNIKTITKTWQCITLNNYYNINLRHVDKIIRVFLFYLKVSIDLTSLNSDFEKVDQLKKILKLKLFQDEKDRLEGKDERIGDGEFYISKDDFIKHFNFVDMCHLTQDDVEAEVIQARLLFLIKSFLRPEKNRFINCVDSFSNLGNGMYQKALI